MIKHYYDAVVRHPKVAIGLILAITVYFLMQLPGLRWETDARVYLPKGHAAILYDEKVDETFGVKDAVIIGIVNEEKGVFNYETLARIARVTQAVAGLQGVVAARSVDVASLTTATMFVGTESSMGSEPLMSGVPESEEEIERLRATVYANADLFVGNLVSADGKAAMIRAKLKEGQANRYMTYWQIQGILANERGEGAAWSSQWGGGSEQWQAANQQVEQQRSPTDTSADIGTQISDSTEWQPGEWQQQSPELTQSVQQQAAPSQPGAGEDRANWWQQKNQGSDATEYEDNGDRFYLAGRPVIEVTSGMHAMHDMQVMIPVLMLVMALSLFIIFRTWRGVLLPLFVMGAAIVWTLGAMVVFDVPLYTISTMLPVILVAVSIGDSVHLMSHYYDQVLEDAQRSSAETVKKVLQRLGAPLVTTSVTTAVGFLSLGFAEMPPFVIFGIFTVLGILFSWLLTVTMIPAVLTVLKPKVGGYLAKRRALRVYAEQNQLNRVLVGGVDRLRDRRGLVWGVLAALIAVSTFGASKLYVDSSWMSDFSKDSELVHSNDMFNDKFSGTIFLNVVIEGDVADTFKSPELLRQVEGLQRHLEKVPYVGASRSVVDYIKNMNKTLHAGDEAYNVIPASQALIGEYLFLFSVSGRPEQLDDVIDFDYKKALVTFSIKTDHTQDLRRIIDEASAYAGSHFSDYNVEVNYAGSANNSYVWADLLIDSQTLAIFLSKIGILLIAALLFRSLWTGLYTVVPVTLATLIVAGFAGLAGIPLDVSTALAAGVAIGVGVDYAVHYIFRYRAEWERSGDHAEAARVTMRTVGKTIVFNAVVVTAGFAVLFFSQFPPHVKLGYFVVSYMVVSCVVALVVLPMLFSLRERAPAHEKVASVS